MMPVFEPATIAVPPGLPDPFWRRALLFQFIYSMTGLVFGVIFAAMGVVLFFHGVSGTTSWTADILGGKSTVNDAAPGVVLFIVSLYVVFVTRFTIKPGKYGNAARPG